MSAILKNQIQPVSENRLFSIAMTSVLSHWLTAKPFVLSLYKCDTTRMVGRIVNSIAMYTSLLNIYITACISLIPYIYLHRLHLINPPHIPTHPTSH